MGLAVSIGLVLGVLAVAIGLMRKRREQPIIDDCVRCGRPLKARTRHNVTDAGGTAEDRELSPGEGWAVSAGFCSRHCIGGCDKPKEHK